MVLRFALTGRVPVAGFTEPHAGPVVVKEFDSALFESGFNLVQRLGLRADDSLEGFHAADGANGDACHFGELDLIPAHKHARGAQLSSSGKFQTRTLTRLVCKPQRNECDSQLIDYDN